MNPELQPQTRRVGRTILLIAGLALAGSTAFATWWVTTLYGLPDVGDPFDVAAYGLPIPDETNAFIPYRKATGLLTKTPEQTTSDWASASQEERDWLARNAPALEAWREGTRRPDALYLDPGSLNFETRLDVAQSLRNLARLALLQGSKLETEGDVSGAFGLYRDLLRSSRHVGRRGTFIERLIGIAMNNLTSARLTRWAADPRVDANLLRQALDAALLAGAATPPTSDGLKTEYLSLLRSIADPELMVKMHSYYLEPTPGGGSITRYPDPSWKDGLTRVRRRAIQEPERSRRVIRLIFSNWLAYCDLPQAQQPPRALSKITTLVTGPARTLLSDLFYNVGPDAPASVKALPPEKVAGWFATTIDAEAFLPATSAVLAAVRRERGIQAALVVTLANELHKREHGQYPEKVEDLVGPYLKALPEGYPTSPTK